MTEPERVWAENLTDEHCDAIPGRQPGPLDADQVRALVRELRRMSHQQQTTDEWGDREVAWYYCREDLEKLLGLDPGALDMDEYVVKPDRPEPQIPPNLKPPPGWEHLVGWGRPG